MNVEPADERAFVETSLAAPFVIASYDSSSDDICLALAHVVVVRKGSRKATAPAC